MKAIEQLKAKSEEARALKADIKAAKAAKAPKGQIQSAKIVLNKLREEVSALKIAAKAEKKG